MMEGGVYKGGIFFFLSGLVLWDNTTHNTQHNTESIVEFDQFNVIID